MALLHVWKEVAALNAIWCFDYKTITKNTMPMPVFQQVTVYSRKN
jgi:hypothetical protein